MRKSLFIIVAAALLAGCGGSGSSAKLSSGDVAVVGGRHISKQDFTSLLAQAKQSFKSQGRTFPKQGTTDYQTIQGQAVTLLVQQAERQEKAANMGITVTNKDIDTRLAQIKKQYFGGSDKKYRQQLKTQHLTDAQVRQDIRAQLISEDVFNKVTKGVSVSDKDVSNYYAQHQSLYSRPQTRDVRYILVGKSKTTAQSVYDQLKNGNEKTWCTLAKKYAKDASGQNCGKATFSKGQTVPVFDRTAFSAPTGQVVKPFFDPTSYHAWFVIEPISPVRAKSTTPEKQVAATIRQQLLQQKKNQAMSDWVASVTKQYCSGSKVKYQVGYAPNPDPCTAATTSSSSTATG